MNPPVKRGLIHLPQIEPSKPGPKPKPAVYVWDRERLLMAHRRYVAGDRNDWTCEGERLYNTRRRRVQRSGLSATDRAWCEQQVGVWARQAWDRENRKENPDPNRLRFIAAHLNVC